MNPSHGLSWEKSGEQEGVFATLFILTGKLQTANLYLGDIIKVSANVTTVGWHNNDINIPTAAKIDGYEFVEYILSADTYRISGISHSGSSITYYVNTVGTSANINCIPLYKRL